MPPTPEAILTHDTVSRPARVASLRRRALEGVFACAALGLLAAYIVLAQAPAVGTFHDDGVYLVTAKALAEDHGYRIISIPGEPPQTKYPILLPWLLSVVWRLAPSFPANLPWLRLVPLAATVIWLALSWSLLRRLGASRLERATIVLLTAVSPWVAFLSTALMSETVFAATLTAGLLVLTRIHQGQGARLDGFLAGLLAGLAVLTRTAGVAPAVAGLLVLAFAKRWKLSAQYLAAMAAVTLPWFAWVGYQNWAAAAIDSYYSATNYRSWNILASYDLQEKIAVVAGNALYGGLATAQIWGLFIPSVLLAIVCAVASVTCLGRGLWQARREPAAVLIGAYCALHAAWVWPPLRFAIPALPLLLWFGFVGTGRSRRLASVIALILLSVGVFRVSAVTHQAYEKGIAWPARGIEDWHETSRLLTWVSERTPKEAIVTGNLDPSYYLFTGRKALRAFEADPYLLYYNAGGKPTNPLGTVEEFRNRLLAIEADYLILTPSEGFQEIKHLRKLIAELSRSFAGSLTSVAGDAGTGYVVYKIDRQVLGSQSALTARNPGARRRSS